MSAAKAADIPDEAFLAAVRSTPAASGALHEGGWRLRHEVQATLEQAIGPVPEKVFLAKARKLIHRRLICGCPCGCRGDYHIPQPEADGRCGSCGDLVDTQEAR